jgi:hypothetical protein
MWLTLIRLSPQECQAKGLPSSRFLYNQLMIVILSCVDWKEGGHKQAYATIAHLRSLNYMFRAADA